MPEAPERPRTDADEQRHQLLFARIAAQLLRDAAFPLPFKRLLQARAAVAVLEMRNLACRTGSVWKEKM